MPVNGLEQENFFLKKVFFQIRIMIKGTMFY